MRLVTLAAGATIAAGGILYATHGHSAPRKPAPAVQVQTVAPTTMAPQIGQPLEVHRVTVTTAHHGTVTSKPAPETPTTVKAAPKAVASPAPTVPPTTEPPAVATSTTAAPARCVTNGRTGETCAVSPESRLGGGYNIPPASAYAAAVSK